MRQPSGHHRYLFVQTNMSERRLIVLDDELKCRHLILYFRYELSGKVRHLRGLIILQSSSTTLHPTLFKRLSYNSMNMAELEETKLQSTSTVYPLVCLTRDTMLRNNQLRAVMRAENH